MSALRSTLRRATLARPAFAARSFHTTPRALVRPGDEIPDLDVLHEGSPGNTISLAEEFKSSNGYIIGVPAAFSGTCSAQHIPSYINHPKLKDAGKVFVVSVNDAFVMKAWNDQLDPANQTGIRFLADFSGKFTNALELDFDASSIFGHNRSKRYVLEVVDGKVASAHVEPDNTGYTVTSAENVLGKN